MIDFLQARSYRAGRHEGPRLIVLHTTETGAGVGAARAVARWFSGPSAPKASAHYIVGPDEVVQCVREEDTAWHAPPTNDYSIGIEHAAKAKWSDEDWASIAAKTVLERSAELVAGICMRHGIPVEFVDEEGLKAGASGITTHAAVGRSFKKSDHWDPGPHFPMEEYLEMVRSNQPHPGELNPA